ncbi:hypothetical protein OH77DRAFT_1261519 [Trametes cingulata]|nr:hypothetical protein OH77DRAFT_1261519 [Trametes cingulata]
MPLACSFPDDDGIRAASPTTVLRFARTHKGSMADTAARLVDVFERRGMPLARSDGHHARGKHRARGASQRQAVSYCSGAHARTSSTSVLGCHETDNARPQHARRV